MAESGISFEIVTDNSETVKRQLEANIPKALDQMGLMIRSLIIEQLQSGFGREIRKTGDLQRSIDYEVEGDEIVFGVKQDFMGKTEPGKDMIYGWWVHDGTSKMAGRPYIRNATYGEAQMKKIVSAGEPALKEGFK